ncbi:MAG: AAA family ATPase [Myxococcota bacterium]
MFELDEWERAWRARLPEGLPETVVEGSFGIMASLSTESPDVLALLLDVFTDLHRGSTRTRLGPSFSLPGRDTSKGKGPLVEAGLLVDLGEWVAGATVHRQERSIQEALRARAHRTLDTDQGARMRSAVDRGGALGDDQRAALEKACQASTLAIVGGPGTGKTWLTALIVEAWLEAGLPSRRIACLTPTGKASQRLGEALGALPVPSPQTLHRMLGWGSRSRTRESEPLPVDAVLVDEASMVDLDLMERLLLQLDPERLVLVGDPAQLPSVAAGAPFRDLVEHHPEWVARLEVGRRQNDPLTRFARAVAEGQAEPVRTETLPPPEAEGVFLAPFDPGLLESWARTRLGRPGQQVLTVLRGGGNGAERTNQRLTSWRRSADPGALHPEGQPLMVTRNDYGRRLFNGEVGRVEGGQVVFERAQEKRRFPMGSLALTPADAITVHKAQGSEFESVLLLLPDRPHPLVDRALLYTAVTRARRQVVIVGGEETWRAGLAATRHRRTSA